MTQYGTAHDRKIGIGADKVMRELPHKVKQPRESLFVYFHGNVSAVEDNAVLIVIDIGRILEKPAFCAEIERNNAVVRPARMTYPAGIALVFKAELAAAISRGSFSGLERLIVMSSSPYSLSNFHLRSRAMRSRRM